MTTTPAASPADQDDQDAAHYVIVYSPLAERRAAIVAAVGQRPDVDLGRIEWIECSTGEELIDNVDRGGIAVAILDGEAQPTGGMGLSRQLKNEIDDCPAIVVAIARPADRWLATWSLADATLTYPIDPILAGPVIAQQLRNRLQGVPVLR